MKGKAMGGAMTVFAFEGVPEVHYADDVAGLILESAESGDLAAGDVVVIAQKIVSKAEGAVADLREVTPSAFARSVSESTGKDARIVEVVLQQSRRIVRMSRGVLICETHHGFVCANAGVDASNVPGTGAPTGNTGSSPAADRVSEDPLPSARLCVSAPVSRATGTGRRRQARGEGGSDPSRASTSETGSAAEEREGSTTRGRSCVTVLPADPDGSARGIRRALEAEVGGPLGVIIADSFGRPWREGSVNVAIGVAGIRPLLDLRGQPDDYGRPLRATQVAVADEIASAAQLAGGEVGRKPVVVVRGLPREWLLPADSEDAGASGGADASKSAGASQRPKAANRGDASRRAEESEAGARLLLRDPSRDLFR